MQELCKDMRKRFSASVSVSLRQGSESSKKELWSINIQGKVAPQVTTTTLSLNVLLSPATVGQDKLTMYFNFILLPIRSRSFSLVWV